MSPPRRHYGPKPPGRLQATLLKVAAAELTDGGRLGRGKRYFADGAVTDIEIQPGLAVAIVQGSSVTPYEVTVTVGRGEGAPSAADVGADCNCVDSDRGAFCKHSVAALFAIANEVAIEPELLEVLRSGPHTASTASMAPVISLAERRAHRSPSTTDDPNRDGVADDDPNQDDTTAEINAMLVSPHLSGGVATAASDFELLSPVNLATIQPVRRPPTGDQRLDRLLESALDEFDLNWH